MLLFEDQKSVVYALAFSPDGATLASGAKDGSLLLREADGRVSDPLEAEPKKPAIHAVAYLPDGSLVVGHSHGWHVYRHDAGVWRGFGQPSEASITSLAVIDANTLAVGTGDRVKSISGNIEIWDLARGQRADYHQEPNGVRAVAACPAKQLVAWATGHFMAQVRDIRRPSKIQFPLTRTAPAIALSPAGTLLAAAVDWTVKLFDVDRRQEKATLRGHKAVVSAVAFSPDGSTLATGGGDQTVRLWDAATGREKANFKWPVGRVFSLAYAPDGLRLAAGGDLGSVVVWDVG